MKKIDVGVVVTTLIIVTISCSLAFFAARVVGNPKDINLVAKNVAITFTDTSSIANETISPGWSNVKTFTITNNSKEDFNYNIILKGLVNTFESVNTLQYKITSDVGYNMDNYSNVIKIENSKDVALAYNITIPKNTIQSYQVEFKYISTEEDQSEDMGKKLGGTLAIEASNGSPEIYDKLLADNPTIKTRTNFNSTLTEINVNTLYKGTEDNTDVYYFSGNAQNNWVKFGTWNEDKYVYEGVTRVYDDGSTRKDRYSTLEECKANLYSSSYECTAQLVASKGEDMYWRIIRTNADGSIRLLYAGTSPNSLDKRIGVKAWNDTNNDMKYAGYMYGTSGSLANNRTNENSSTVKTYIDEWYLTNLYDDYDKYVSKKAVYCTDRGTTYSSSLLFPTFNRVTNTSNVTPTYECADSKDAFSGQNNDALLKCSGDNTKVCSAALMSAEEIVYAGGLYGTGADTWYSLNSENTILNDWWWLLSPSSFTSLGTGAFGINMDGGLGGNAMNVKTASVRPVISIRGDNLYKSGDGSASNPYVIEEYTTLSEKLMADNSTIKTRTPAAKETYTETNTGTLFKNTEYDKTVYYFAGDAKNNWVKFGTWQNPEYEGYNTLMKYKGYLDSAKTQYRVYATLSECESAAVSCVKYTPANKGDDMYWRIIRTNADGSIRLLYAGTSTDADNGFISFDYFNESYNSPEYVGYMYGTSESLDANRSNTTDSHAKTIIDSWYKSNLNSLSKYISTDAIYCADRDITSTYDLSKQIMFAGYSYAYSKSMTGYNCSNENDKFSVTSGNKKLTYPVALMTVNEIAYAGGDYNQVAPAPYVWYLTNSLNKGATGLYGWWTMSPSYYNDSTGSKEARIIEVPNIDYTSGGLLSNTVKAWGAGIRPVISVKGTVAYKSGDGSASNPYQIELN